LILSFLRVHILGFIMKKLTLIGFVVLAVGAQASPVVFYGGDWDAVNGLAAQVNGSPVNDSRVYDNFTLATAMNIDSVFGNFVDNTSGNTSSVFWEIRSGMSVGNGGTVLFGGTTAGTRTVMGSIVNYTANISPVTLGPGNYWLSIEVNGGDAQTFIGTTSGRNGVGGPLSDGNSLWDSSFFGQSFSSTSAALGAPGDFSMGITGTQVVPEPASLAVLGLGAVALLRRRRK
jgi:hypothetical protein